MANMVEQLAELDARIAEGDERARWEKADLLMQAQNPFAGLTAPSGMPGAANMLGGAGRYLTSLTEGKEVDPSALFGVGDDALRPLVVPRGTVAQRATTQPATPNATAFPAMGNLRQEGRDARLREGDYPDSNRTLGAQSVPEPGFDVSAELTRIGNMGNVTPSGVSYKGLDLDLSKERAAQKAQYDALAALQAPEMETRDSAALYRKGIEDNKRPTREDVALSERQKGENAVSFGLRLLGSKSGSTMGALAEAGGATLADVNKQRDVKFKDLMDARTEALVQLGTELNLSGQDMRDRNTAKFKAFELGRQKIDDQLKGTAADMGITLKEFGQKLHSNDKKFEGDKFNATIKAQTEIANARNAQNTAMMKLKLAAATQKGAGGKAVDDPEMYKAADLKSLQESPVGVYLQEALGRPAAAQEIRAVALGQADIATDANGVKAIVKTK